MPSPTSISKLVTGGFEPAHRQWLKDTMSTLELDETANKRSRSPTFKEFQRAHSRQVSRSDFETIRTLGKGRISNVFLVR